MSKKNQISQEESVEIINHILATAGYKDRIDLKEIESDSNYGDPRSENNDLVFGKFLSMDITSNYKKVESGKPNWGMDDNLNGTSSDNSISNSIVFQYYDALYYRVSYEYYSYCGASFDSMQMFMVEPAICAVTFYEDVK